MSVFSVVALSGFIYPRLLTTAAGAGTEAAPPQRRSQTQRRRPARTQRTPAPARVDYAQFSHRTAEHQRACDACHKFPSKNWKEVRKGDAAFADISEFPEHSSCIDCHRPQFFARERPQPKICGNCHVNVTPRNTVRWPFPSLGEPFAATPRGQQFVSDFLINFPHDKHVDIVGAYRAAPESAGAARVVAASFRRQDAPKAEETDPKSCGVCHQTYLPQGKSDEEYATPPPKDLGDAFWLKKGTFKTLPRTHATCFTCHNADTGITPASSDCNTCHKLPPAAVRATPAPADFDPKLAAAMGVTDRMILDRWRRRNSSGTFRHEGGMHPALACTACHQVASMNTLEERTLRVAVKSCGGEGTGCHIEEDNSGVLNIEIEQKKANPSSQCTKCHVVFGKQTGVPQDHLNATSKSKTE